MGARNVSRLQLLYDKFPSHRFLAMFPVRTSLLTRPIKLFPWRFMKLRQYLNKLSVVVILTALAVVASTSQAIAQQQPGEDDVYENQERAAVTGFVASAGTLAEARNGGNLLDVWRANDSTNQVWLSWNNGSPFTIASTTQTFVSPAVVAIGNSGFMVFHTGTDGNIYRSLVTGNRVFTPWVSVPGNTTNMTVSVAQMGAGSPNIYMVYRGSGGDTQVWGTWMNSSFEWSSPINIAGGLANASPAICLNNTGSSLWVVVVGTDNQIWTTSQFLGAPSWPFFTPRGVFAGGLPPSCAATAAGTEVMAYVDGNGNPNYASFDNAGNMVTGWTRDRSGYRTQRSVNLSSSGNTVWSLLTGDQVNCQLPPLGPPVNTPCFPVNQIYWKQVYVAP